MFSEELIRSLQDLAAQLPEIIGPFVVMLAGTVPFLHGELISHIGSGGLNPILAGITAASAALRFSLPSH